MEGGHLRSQSRFKIIVEETYNRSIRRICDMEKPVVAAVEWGSPGAGANIALACDFVVAKTSVKFIQAFTNIGLIPDSGGTFGFLGWWAWPGPRH